MKYMHRGFTFTEIVIVVAVLTTLFGLASVNLLGSREKATTASSSDVLASDLRNQQLKAMLGDTEGRVGNDAYGVYFSSTGYTMFHGATYVAADPANQQVTLGDNMQFQNILFPGGIVLFASGSGEIANYTTNADSVKIINVASQDQRTLRLNRQGVISSLQ